MSEQTVSPIERWLYGIKIAFSVTSGNDGELGVLKHKFPHIKGIYPTIESLSDGRHNLTITIYPIQLSPAMKEQIAGLIDTEPLLKNAEITRTP